MKKLFFLFFLFSFFSHSAYSMRLKELITGVLLTGIETNAFIRTPVLHRYMSDEIKRLDTSFTPRLIDSQFPRRSVSVGNWCYSHSSAKPSHYTKEARNYDKFNEINSVSTNQLVESMLRKHEVKTVLDLTCGTGSQVFWLKKLGYEVVGSDINLSMLKIARAKAKKEELDLKFIKRDMCTAQLGKFDAVITIFNAVGHLTTSDFEEAMQNIRKNLKPGGIYIFDINNLSYLLEGNNITTLTIDWQEIVGNTTIRDIQYSTINPEGILTSFTTSYVQKDSFQPKRSRTSQALQIYTAGQLTEMLRRHKFQVLEQCGVDGSKVVEDKTDRIFTIAKNIQDS